LPTWFKVLLSTPSRPRHQSSHLLTFSLEYWYLILSGSHFISKTLGALINNSSMSNLAGGGNKRKEQDPLISLIAVTFRAQTRPNKIALFAWGRRY